MGRHFTILLLLVIVSVEFVAAERKSKSKWSNLYIIVIYVAFFAIAILVSVLIRRYRSGRLGTAEGGANDQSERATRFGMDVEDIESLPSLRFSEIKMHKVSEQGQRECAVCLNEFKDQEILRILPDCLHVFHPDCITPWLKYHVTCPVCRTSLDHRQGSSVSTSSILERISGVFSERFEGISGTLSSELYRVGHPDDDDDRVDRVSTAEIEGSTSLQQVDLDGTGGEMVLVRCYSTGDLGVRFGGENGKSAENCSRVDNRGIISEKSINLSCVSSRSDSFVDYSSLLYVHGSAFV